MKTLPHGWTDQYAVRWLVEQMQRANEKLAVLKAETESLRAEVARLERDKAGRAGRKATRPKREDYEI